jgi:integrase
MTGNANTPTGSVTKRCSCKDPNTGRRLERRCPRLKRPGGAWNPTHGSWGFQLELPTRNPSRRPLRRGGFDERDDATAALNHVRALLDLAGGDRDLTIQIADLLHECPRDKPLPELDAVAARIRAGIPASVATSTADYLNTWLAGRHKLAQKTVRGYRDHITKYLIPHLGEIPLQDLRTGHLEKMFTDLKKLSEEITTARASTDPAVRATVRGVRAMGASSVQRLHATLRKALNDAVTRRTIPINPAVGIELEAGTRPKPRVWTDKAITWWQDTGKRPSPVMVWQPRHAGLFLDYAQVHDPELYAMYLLILHRGLRRGEACGLRDYDVDLDAAYLSVIEQITTVGYTPVTRTVKSDAGDRQLPLGPKTIDTLNDYLTMRDRWQTRRGLFWPKTGLFFVRPDGSPWHPQTVSKRFDKLIADSGLPPVRLHDLRHCAATYLRHGGADMKEVQETLGHATIGLTSDTYTSVILELRHTTADAAADLIPRQPTNTRRAS